ncbi:hypothetical protein [Mycobacterium sp. 852014-52144_SCH5372336]|uniref:hypothetical protein n=1 Tax=Mycobacterium sp. 852014-52144_SCH5372336 TaxID=1834115 RepID=UPI000ADDFC51|nr:hypothetical protein [Mycobacterium sp. 852014-52144_SCH5372336]
MAGDRSDDLLESFPASASIASIYHAAHYARVDSLTRGRLPTDLISHSDSLRIRTKQ